MATRPFLCPNTGDRVQGFADNGSDSETYEAVTCLACRQVHMVNPKTGKVLGADEETDDPLRHVKKAPGCYSRGFRTKQEQRLVS
jgi:hypothetical protein